MVWGEGTLHWFLVRLRGTHDTLEGACKEKNIAGNREEESGEKEKGRRSRLEVCGKSSW